MSIEAHLENRPPEADRRAGARRRLHLQVEGATGDGAPVNVTVLDLSESGLLLQTSNELAIDEALEVELPLAGSQVAKVVWASHNLFGCKFDTPISKAAVSAAQLQAVPQPPPAPAETGESFGTRLRRLRKERDLSLVGLAKMLGVTKPTIWYWENDQARPRPKSLAALAAILEVPVDELVPAEWAAEVPEPLTPTALNETVRACKQQIAQAAGTTPDKVDIAIHL